MRVTFKQTYDQDIVMLEDVINALIDGINLVVTFDNLSVVRYNLSGIEFMEVNE